MWNCYLKQHGELELREFRTVEGEQILNSIAEKNDLSRATMAHVKAFLSGIFRHAKRQGIINTENPMRDVILPRVRPGSDTYAYSLEEIHLALSVLPDPAKTVVGAAAYTGVREGELRGLLWENYDGKEVRITQSVWRGHIQEPKTKASIAPVPVIAPLAEMLDAHRLRSGNPTKGLIFSNSIAKPMCMASVITSKAANSYQFKTGQRKWPSRTENVLPCRLLWWQVGFGAPAPRAALEHVPVV
jgi:integrase